MEKVQCMSMSSIHIHYNHTPVQALNSPYGFASGGGGDGRLRGGGFGTATNGGEHEDLVGGEPLWEPRHAARDEMIFR